MPYFWGGSLGNVGILGIVMFAVVLAFWALIIVGLVLGVRWLIRADRNSRLGGPTGGAWNAAPRPDDPLEILRQRYARGEIDDEEFERRRKTLAGS